MSMRFDGAVLIRDGPPIRQPDLAIARAILHTNPRHRSRPYALLFAGTTADAARAHDLPPEFLGAALLQESAYDPRSALAGGGDRHRAVHARDGRGRRSGSARSLRLDRRRRGAAGRLRRRVSRRATPIRTRRRWPPTTPVRSRWRSIAACRRIPRRASTSPSSSTAGRASSRTSRATLVASRNTRRTTLK